MTESNTSFFLFFIKFIFLMKNSLRGHLVCRILTRFPSFSRNWLDFHLWFFNYITHSKNVTFPCFRGIWYHMNDANMRYPPCGKCQSFYKMTKMPICIIHIHLYARTYIHPYIHMYIWVIRKHTIHLIIPSVLLAHMTSWIHREWCC